MKGSAVEVSIDRADYFLKYQVIKILRLSRIELAGWIFQHDRAIALRSITSLACLKNPSGIAATRTAVRMTALQFASHDTQRRVSMLAD
jgi:hypothetical protein